MDGKCQTCLCLKSHKHPQRGKKITNSQVRDPLKNWERWLEERKKVHKNISKAVGRPPGSLVMNIGEDYRTLQEEKSILENLKIVTTFDKYRGNPEFWEIPYTLPTIYPKCPKLEESRYFCIKTKPQKNEVPEIDYIATPEIILEEKNIFPRTR